MAKKYYVVWQGRETGIFTDWDACKRNVHKFNGAKYKSFASRAEAESAFNAGAGASIGKGTQEKAKSPKKKGNGQTVKTYTAEEIVALEIDTKIFTDGGCEPNPGEAGSGIAVYRDGVIDELWYGAYNPMGTNNTAELNAFLQALKISLSEIDRGRSVAILCDSKYTIQCITQWAINWEKKGWKKAGGEIKNLELIQELFALHQSLKDRVQVLHVNGHVGVEGNELADRMSILAIEEKDKDFVLYGEAIDIQAIMAMREG